MCRICVSLGLVRSIPESRFLVLFLACVFSLNPIFELLLGRGHTQCIAVSMFVCNCACMDVHMYVRAYVYVCVCIHGCMHAWMWVCVYNVHMCTYVCTQM